MDLPPPSYALLVGVTLVAYPFVLRAAASQAARRTARDVVLSLVLLEVALALLFYSRLVCWVLAGVASVWLLTASPGRVPRRALFMQASAALAAGLLFQFLPGLYGFAVYFGFGLPVLFGVPLAWLVGHWLRYDGAWGTWLGAGGAMLFAGWFVVSAFYLDFLVSFELLHLLVVVVAMVGLALLVGRGWQRMAAARRAARTAPDEAAYLARPVGGGVASFAFGAAALLPMMGLVGSVSEELVVPLVGFALSGLGLLGVFALLARGSEWGVVRAVGGAIALGMFLGPLVAVSDALWSVYVASASVPFRLPLVLAGVAATLGLMAVAAAWGFARELSARAEVAEGRGRLPPEALADRTETVPDVAALRRFARAVASRDHRVGVLTVAAPLDPLWTVPDEVHEWLVSQQNPDVRVHLAVEEPGAVYLVPGVWPEEHDA